MGSSWAFGVLQGQRAQDHFDLAMGADLKRGSGLHYPCLIEVLHQVGASLENRNGGNPGEPSGVSVLVGHRRSVLSQHLSMPPMFQGYSVDPSSGMCSLQYYWPQKQAVRPKGAWIHRGI